jgi:hypothetical protein
MSVRYQVWINAPGVAFVAGLLLLSIGCGRQIQEQRFIPSEQDGQRALETALTAWKNGKVPPARVQEPSPAIEFVDTHHQAGQKLTAFTVLGPTAGDAHRCYAVRLTLDNPREEVRARYVVYGLDPLWVSRYEDYEMMCHWDHPQTEKATASKKLQPSITPK